MQLTVENLSKNYRGSVQALRNVQLTLKPGVLGLLGPNGAARSTLLRILATIAPGPVPRSAARMPGRA